MRQDNVLEVEEAISAIIAAGERAAALGWVPATSGNFSVRAGEMIAITRTGRDKGNLRHEDIAVVSLDAPLTKGLSAEAALHLSRYATDASVGAVFHVHMPIAATLGRRYLPDGQLLLEGWELQKAFEGINDHLARIRIPILPNSQNVQALADAAEIELRRPSDATTAPGYIVDGHGLNTWGRTSAEAQRNLEAFGALLLLHAQWLGYCR